MRFNPDQSRGQHKLNVGQSDPLNPFDFWARRGAGGHRHHRAPLLSGNTCGSGLFPKNLRSRSRKPPSGEGGSYFVFIF
jgi:hypothetical protein